MSTSITAFTETEPHKEDNHEQVDDDDDVVIEDMSTNKSNADALKSSTDSNDTDKENQNTSNRLAPTSSTSYHGEYHKALTDALIAFLDSAFKKHMESPYASWLKYFEKSMEKDVNKILHFYPILLHELKSKIQHHYLSEFDRIEAAKHLSYLQNKLALTFYKDDAEGLDDENDEKSSSNDTSLMMMQESESEVVANAEIISYSDPKQTIRDQQLLKINATFRREIEAIDQKIAMAQYKKNELLSKIEEKKKTLFAQ